VWFLFLVSNLNDDGADAAVICNGIAVSWILDARQIFAEKGYKLNVFRALSLWVLKPRFGPRRRRRRWLPLRSITLLAVCEARWRNVK
jgi:hypothetical protein